MSATPITVDRAGLHLALDLGDSCDVLFDGQHVWSFTPPEADPDGEPRLVRWPGVMLAWLDGVAQVSLVTRDGTEVFSGEVRFGDSDARIRFVDKDGLAVMIDKWGLLQRPFSGRGDGVVDEMVRVTETMCEVLERECGVRAWIAFGTLLGAARSGKVIGHDSDIDLAYLSEQTTPAAMAVEMFRISRALRAAGLSVMNKSGSFITVLFNAADGGQSSIDLYTCFYVGDLLHETATVRAPVPRSAIEPLTRLEFEGRLLPAPADPDAVLTASYGPNWRVPDPSFTHRPGLDIKRRFDPWFGSVMRYRRAWESYWRGTAASDAERTASSFQGWVSSRLAPGVQLVEIGFGNGVDALAFAAEGRPVLGLDYARGSHARATDHARAAGLDATFAPFNLYDLRDVLTRGALVVRSTPGPRVVYARSVLDALEPDGLENFWRFADLTLRGGGTAYVEFGSPPAPPGPATGGRRFALTPEQVEREAALVGGTVQERERVDGPAGQPPRWRMTVAWDANNESG